MKKLMPLYCLLILLSSCIKEIEVKYPEGGQQLTLNCVLIPGETIRANLTHTVSFEQLNAPPYYKDAIITLYENGKLADTLRICQSIFRENQGDTLYTYCSDYPVQVGNTYKVKAQKAGFADVYGETTIPEKAKITRIYTEEDQDFGDPFEITILDVSTANNYYILQIGSSSAVENYIADLSTDDPVISLYSAYGIIHIPTDPRSGSKAFFTDQYFSNHSKLIKLRASFSQTSEKPNFVRLYSVSEEYYDYLKSLEINHATGENPFSEPVRVKSNIKNGFGLVGSFNLTQVNF